MGKSKKTQQSKRKVQKSPKPNLKKGQKIAKVYWLNKEGRCIYTGLKEPTSGIKSAASFKVTYLKEDTWELRMRTNEYFRAYDVGDIDKIRQEVAGKSRAFFGQTSVWTEGMPDTTMADATNTEVKPKAKQEKPKKVKQVKAKQAESTEETKVDATEAEDTKATETEATGTEEPAQAESQPAGGLSEQKQNSDVPEQEQPETSDELTEVEDEPEELEAEEAKLGEFSNPHGAKVASNFYSRVTECKMTQSEILNFLIFQVRCNRKWGNCPISRCRLMDTFGRPIYLVDYAWDEQTTLINVDRLFITSNWEKACVMYNKDKAKKYKFGKPPAPVHMVGEQQKLVFDYERPLGDIDTYTLNHIVNDRRMRWPEQYRNLSEAQLSDLLKFGAKRAFELATMDMSVAIPRINGDITRVNFMLPFRINTKDGELPEAVLLLDTKQNQYRVCTMLTVQQGWVCARGMLNPEMTWLKGAMDSREVVQQSGRGGCTKFPKEKGASHKSSGVDLEYGLRDIM